MPDDSQSRRCSPVGAGRFAGRWSTGRCRTIRCPVGASRRCRTIRRPVGAGRFAGRSVPDDSPVAAGGAVSAAEARYRRCNPVGAARRCRPRRCRTIRLADLVGAGRFAWQKPQWPRSARSGSFAANGSRRRARRRLLLCRGDHGVGRARTKSPTAASGQPTRGEAQQRNGAPSALGAIGGSPARESQANIDHDAVYDAGGQLRLVLAVTAFALVSAAVGLFLAWQLGSTLGLSPADGGVLRPLGQRIAIASAVAGIGLAFVGEMMLYLRLYVTQLRVVERDDDGRAVVIGAKLAFPGLRLPLHEGVLRGARDHDGRSQHVRGVSVAAPWRSLHLRERRLPLILDVQGRWLRPAQPGRCRTIRWTGPSRCRTIRWTRRIDGARTQDLLDLSLKRASIAAVALRSRDASHVRPSLQAPAQIRTVQYRPSQRQPGPVHHGHPEAHRLVRLACIHTCSRRGFPAHRGVDQPRSVPPQACSRRPRSNRCQRPTTRPRACTITLAAGAVRFVLGFERTM